MIRSREAGLRLRADRFATRAVTPGPNIDAHDLCQYPIELLHESATPSTGDVRRAD